MTHPSKLMCIENEMGYNRKRKRSSSDSSPASKRRRQKVSVQKMQAKYIAKQAAKRRKLIALGFPVDSGDEDDAMRQGQKDTETNPDKKASDAIDNVTSSEDSPSSNGSERSHVGSAEKLSHDDVESNHSEPSLEPSHSKSTSKDQRVRAWVEKVDMEKTDIGKSGMEKTDINQSENEFDSPVIPARNSITPPSKPSSPVIALTSNQPCSSKTRVVVVTDDSNITKRESGVSSEMQFSDLPSDATMDTIGNDTQELLDYSLPSIPSGELHYNDDARDGEFLKKRDFALFYIIDFRSFS